MAALQAPGLRRGVGTWLVAGLRYRRGGIRRVRRRISDRRQGGGRRRFDRAERRRNHHQAAVQTVGAGLANLQRWQGRHGVVQAAGRQRDRAQPHPRPEPQPDLRQDQLQRPDLPHQHPRHHLRRRRAVERGRPGGEHARPDPGRFPQAAFQPRCARRPRRCRQPRHHRRRQRRFGQPDRRQRPEQRSDRGRLRTHQPRWRRQGRAGFRRQRPHQRADHRRVAAALRHRTIRRRQQGHIEIRQRHRGAAGFRGQGSVHRPGQQRRRDRRPWHQHRRRRGAAGGQRWQCGQQRTHRRQRRAWRQRAGSVRPQRGHHRRPRRCFRPRWRRQHPRGRRLARRRRPANGGSDLHRAGCHAYGRCHAARQGRLGGGVGRPGQQLLRQHQRARRCTGRRRRPGGNILARWPQRARPRGRIGCAWQSRHVAARSAQRRHHHRWRRQSCGHGAESLLQRSNQQFHD